MAASERKDSSKDLLQELKSLQQYGVRIHSDENKSQRSTSQDYIAVYVFQGRIVNHVALWAEKQDFGNIYSYGYNPAVIDPNTKRKQEFAWIETAIDENHADQCLSTDYVYNDYGPWKKIIIPVDRDFIEKKSESLLVYMFEHYQPSKYKLFSKNCVSVVEDYLIKANLLTAKIPVKVIATATNIDEASCQIGLDRFNKWIEKEEKRIKSEKEIAHMKKYLLLMREELKNTAKNEGRSIPSNGGQQLLIYLQINEIEKLSLEGIQKKYYEVVKELAKLYYSSSNFRALTSQRWYTEWMKVVFKPKLIDNLPHKLSHITEEIVVKNKKPSASYAANSEAARLRL